MDNKSNLKPEKGLMLQDKEDIILAGIMFLQRSKNVKEGLNIEVNCANSQEHLPSSKYSVKRVKSYLSVKELQCMILMKAVKESEKWENSKHTKVTKEQGGTIDQENEAIHKPRNALYKRRDAVCEKSQLDRNGLYTMLREYLLIKRLHSYSII